MSKPNFTFSLLPSTLLKPYPAYKDSGVEWLGEVPEHWEVRRLKQVFQRIIGGATPASGESSFWDGEVVWITPADVSKRQRLTTSARTLTEVGLHACSADLAPSGSIIVTSRAPVGNVALAATELCTNQGCKSLITDGRVVDSEFAFVVMQTMKHELQSLATGTTFTEISTNKLGIVPFPLPPLPEQAAIVRYLDYVDRRIRRYIRAKQKLIGLLEEQKQAIIHRAVTRGLDPDVPLKPSGVEWLGEVPEHWEVGTLRRNLRPYDGIKIGPFGSQLKLDQMSDSGYKVYGQANVIAKDFARGRKFIDQNKFNELSVCEIIPGDLVLTMMGTSGRCARVPDDAVLGIMDSHLLRLRTSPKIDDGFAALVIDKSPYIKEQISVAGKGSIMHGLNSGIAKNLVLALPPLPEQAAIVEHLDQATTDIDTAIDRARREISLLREYRTRLIADVVTGKLDVRAAAAGLPEELDEPEALHETDALSDAVEQTEMVEELEA